MEFKLDDRIVDAAAKAPEVFIAASLGEGEEYNREPGIQLTKEQIISLRKYEVLGLSLPYRYNDVVAYLNYGAGDEGGLGLTARDFLRTFTMTYDHAKRWSPLRQEIMLTGTHLKLFAGKIIENGEGIVEVYEDREVAKYLDEHDINTVEEYLQLKLKHPRLPDITLPSGDIPEIKYYLNAMLTDVKDCQTKAERVRLELDRFGIDLREKVLPEVKLRLKAVSENTYKQDIQVLQDEIDLRAAEIDELNKQYDQMVKDAIMAAATLNIGGLVLGIYQGVKAEQVRSKRKQLKEMQDIAIQKMASKSQTLSSLNRVRGDLQNLSAITIEAEVATQNLMLVWEALGLYISSSATEVDKINDAVRLKTFIRNVRKVFNPWVEIRTSSDALLAVFAEAQREYEMGNLISRRMARMISAFKVSDYPAFDVAALRTYNSDVQSSSIRTQMLFQRHDYLPGVVERMTGLALVIDRTTYALRSRAQTTIYVLSRARDNLEEIQEDFESAHDENEKHDISKEMEEELKGAFAKIIEETKDLKKIQIDLKTRYDKDASQQWMATLEQDRTFAETQKNNAEAKRVELDSQMKSISDAIALIERSGVEKIGKEAQLTVDNLTAMGMAPPQVQVTLLAMDMLKKMLSGMAETISYINMVAGYNRLQERARKLRSEAEAYAKEIALIQGKVELVQSLDALDSGRWDYVKEFVNIVSAFEQFSRAFEQEKSQPVEERARAVRPLIPGIISYLLPIRG
ncbi:alpha-xenorhabdolysin family binary toxin subunit A [Pseudomonas sp. B21-054]|uniref:alpha-xenorhabdolysin family binary toxin subunit A n=1 Tax=Pseudomonas sp. B21-054 TaxID=2895494 RepID=UPI00223268EC|nr:alpha-xenorhabdolysin family binary toxin subunit A [Pseudomonas sp. B21-054]UZE18804.1 alpha-xenorhabdolysin family binary toxin subunit A [Pseudomonas sp. B21-054]